MKTPKNRKPKKARSFETLTAITHCKAVIFRHKTARRAKARKNDWKDEDEDN